MTSTTPSGTSVGRPVKGTSVVTTVQKVRREDPTGTRGLFQRRRRVDLIYPNRRGKNLGQTLLPTPHPTQSRKCTYLQINLENKSHIMRTGFDTDYGGQVFGGRNWRSLLTYYQKTISSPPVRGPTHLTFPFDPGLTENPSETR